MLVEIGRKFRDAFSGEIFTIQYIGKANAFLSGDRGTERIEGIVFIARYVEHIEPVKSSVMYAFIVHNKDEGPKHDVVYAFQNKAAGQLMRRQFYDDSSTFLVSKIFAIAEQELLTLKEAEESERYEKL